MNKTIDRIFDWTARIAAAVILIQTLYFKFSGSDESVYIFTTVGMEPWGRWAIGSLELITGLMLLFNATASIGALLAAGLMLGALGMHATLLGIEVRGDGGYLFFLAIIVMVSSIAVLFIRYKVLEKAIRLLRNGNYFNSAKAASNS